MFSINDQPQIGDSIDFWFNKAWLRRTQQQIRKTGVSRKGNDKYSFFCRTCYDDGFAGGGDCHLTNLAVVVKDGTIIAVETDWYDTYSY